MPPRSGLGTKCSTVQLLPLCISLSRTPLLSLLLLLLLLLPPPHLPLRQGMASAQVQTRQNPAFIDKNSPPLHPPPILLLLHAQRRVLPDRALCLPSFSHFLAFLMSIKLVSHSLSPPPPPPPKTSGIPANYNEFRLGQGPVVCSSLSLPLQLSTLAAH